MQNYFEQHDEFKGTSNLSFQLTFVATICNILINLLAPLGQLLLALLEARTVLFLSISLCSAGLLLASFSTQVKPTYIKYIIELMNDLGLASILDTWSDLWHRFIHYVLCKYTILSFYIFY